MPTELTSCLIESAHPILGRPRGLFAAMHVCFKIIDPLYREGGCILDGSTYLYYIRLNGAKSL